MAIYTQSKNGIGDVYPSGSIEATFERLEPLITPVLLRKRHLWGIPLVSGMKDPRTGKAEVMEDPTLADAIDRACAVAEAETHLLIFPTQVEEKQPWDIHHYRSFGFFRLLKKPISSIEGLFVTPSNEIDVYEVPIEWVETANLHHGQLNIVPLTIALNKGAGMNPMAAGPASAVFLSLFGHGPWIPAFFRIRYTAGFPNGKLPKLVNELIGVIAAMDVLSVLAPTFAKQNSTSLSIDGMSQSVSTPGPELFRLRIEELEKKRAMLVGKLRSAFATKLFAGEV